MFSLAAFLWAFALTTPVEDAQPVGQGHGPLVASGQQADHANRRDTIAIWDRLVRGTEPSDAAQVRIEQHVIMRVIPRPSAARESLTALAPTAPQSLRIEEREMDGCVTLGNIAAVQPRGNSRLLLYMTDRRLVAADLERSCSARDFYSGFYVEKSSDGQLCVGRDKVLSRSGARCELSGFRQLIAHRE